MKRFCRLTIGFSRKIENLQAAANLHVTYFNFCWRPGEMRVTLAQAAWITDHCWTIDELMALAARRPRWFSGGAFSCAG
jgi:hypothetical protein